MKSIIGGCSTQNNRMRLTRRTIDILIIQGRNLKSADINKLCSPYVRLKFGPNKKYRTQVKYTGRERSSYDIFF